MKTEFKVTMPLHEYEKLSKAQQLLDEKRELIYMVNYWGDHYTTFYYNKEAEDEVQKRIIYILEEYEQKLINENKPPLSKKGKSWIKQMFNIK